MIDVLGLAPAGQGTWRRHFQALQHPAAGKSPRRNRPPVAAAPQFEVSVCCHKTCKAQGSKQISQFVKDLALSQVEVHETGCHNNCGNGPNVMVKAVGTPGRRLSHVSTPARMAKVLSSHCGVHVDAAMLKATELRLAGNAAARAGDLRKAEQLFSEGLAVQSTFGRHLLLSNRSGIRLTLGDYSAALADAEAALECAPADYIAAYVRQVEALQQMGRHTDAMQALLAGAARSPAFASSQEYHQLVVHVEHALHAQHVRQ